MMSGLSALATVFYPDNSVFISEELERGVFVVFFLIILAVMLGRMVVYEIKRYRRIKRLRNAAKSWEDTVDNMKAESN